MRTYTDVQHRSKDMMRQAEEMPSSLYYYGVLASIALSAALFLMGRRNLGIFVGLWPPTILNLALFNKQLHPSRDMNRVQDSGSMNRMQDAMQVPAQEPMQQDMERRYGT